MSKRIRIAMVTNHFGITGISTVILNYCKALDHSKFDLTVIVGKPVDHSNIKECEKNRIKLIVLPSRHQETIRHYLSLGKELKKGHYDIVHIHGSSSMMAIEMTIARMVGCHIIVAHSHNSSCPNIKIHKILNPYFRKIYTKALACGDLAGEWLYGKNQFEVLPNGFDTEKFIFNMEGRERIRKELGIEDKFVIGHVGRFNNQKNQVYLLQVFEKLAPMRTDAFLVLVGTGPDFNKIQTLVESSRYKDRIILYGVTKDTSALYSAMDIFVLPSRHEGLPVVLLEAQISGLPCVVSDKVTKEVDFGNIVWVSIGCNPEIWAQKISNIGILKGYRRENYYFSHKEQIERYDIKNTVKQLEHIYELLLERDKLSYQ